jgi:hypothetical protein
MVMEGGEKMGETKRIMNQLECDEQRLRLDVSMENVSSKKEEKMRKLIEFAWKEIKKIASEEQPQLNHDSQ